MAQVLIPDEIREKLLENGRRTAAGEDIDPVPVVKLFMPGTGWTWLLTELNPDQPDIAFGLATNGTEDPEYGYVSISEITSVKNRMGLGVERDEWFTPKGPLSEYAMRDAASFAL